MRSKEETDQLVSIAHERLRDLTEDNTELAFLLGDLIIKLTNEEYKPNLSSSKLGLIKQNYPDATDALIQARSLSDSGLYFLIALCNQLMEIGIDYTPSTYAHAEIKVDTSSQNKIPKAQQIAEKAYMDIIELGVSAFGCTSILMAIASENSIKDGLSPFKLSRTFIERINYVCTAMSNNDQVKKEREDATLDLISKHMRISKAAARKYLK